ncbi:MAG: HEAT repeat domain-containing protein [Dehalococcoidia bacterium]|nr:HEAT repeat domain-containing protein [Dehalococcoidia bacterium]
MSSITCRYHPGQIAELQCADCHKHFCSKCVKEIGGKYYCKVCQSRLKAEREPGPLGRLEEKWGAFLDWVATPLARVNFWYLLRNTSRAAEYKDVKEKQLQEQRLKDGSLLRDLTHKDNSFRRRAADTLGTIGDARAVEPLIQALKDKGQYVRSSAARALGSIGDTKAVGSLIQALKDERPVVRGEAASALGRIGDVGAVEPLTQALEDENSIVRKAAEEALNRIRQSS